MPLLAACQHWRDLPTTREPNVQQVDDQNCHDPADSHVHSNYKDELCREIIITASSTYQDAKPGDFSHKPGGGQHSEKENKVDSHMHRAIVWEFI
jgi:hypothetical protein